MTVQVTVTDVHQMTPDVKQFRLVADDHTFEFRPGQHTQIHFQQDGEEVERPYTAITQPGTGQICLAIKRYDDGTASVWMHDREPGDGIAIDPVDGNLYVRDMDRDAVFAATGTGITPIFPMLKHYAREGDGHAHLVFGERDQEHLIFRESLDQLRAEHEHISVDYVLSDADEGWPGRTGHVQDHLPEGLDAIDHLADADCYACGVPQMVVETGDLLEAAGADEERVFTEGWERDATEE